MFVRNQCKEFVDIDFILNFIGSDPLLLSIIPKVFGMGIGPKSNTVTSVNIKRSVMKTALIELTHKKAIDFLREMEEAELIRVLNISRLEEERNNDEVALQNSGYGYIHEPFTEDDLSSDFPSGFPPRDPQSTTENSAP